MCLRPPPDVTTYRNDNLRSGQNLSETYFAPQHVTPLSFGKVGFVPTDGKSRHSPSVRPMDLSSEMDTVKRIRGGVSTFTATTRRQPRRSESVRILSRL